MPGRTIWQRLRGVPTVDVGMVIIHALLIAIAALCIALPVMSILHFHDLPMSGWRQAIDWVGIFVLILIINSQARSLFGVLRRIFDNLWPKPPPRTRDGRAHGRRAGRRPEPVLDSGPNRMSGRPFWQRLKGIPEVDFGMAAIHTLVIVAAALCIVLGAVNIRYFHDLPIAGWRRALEWGGIFVLMLIINSQARSLFGVLRRIFDNLWPEPPPRTRDGRARGSGKRAGRRPKPVSSPGN